MSAARQLPRALLAMGTSLAVLTACSAGSTSPTLDAGACSGASPAELTSTGSGEVCADNGFQPGTDGFSFANWGGTPTDDAIESGTLIAMFGRESVCANVDTDGCVMQPAAQAWMSQMNEALANGRCEGMAVLSERLFAGLAKATELDPRATRTIELARTDPAVARTLGYWWLTQFPIEVSGPTSKSRALRPSQIVEQVISGLEQGSGNTLGLYSEFGGHAVTPIAVVKEGSNFTISVYDSNDPGVIKHIIVDPVAEEWVYDAKANSTGKVTERWSGSGVGSMDLTPMAVRSGAFTAPFGDGPDADTYVTVTSPKDGANVGAVITRGSTVIDTRSLAANLPDDVVVHRITGTGAGVQVILKGDAGAVTVRAVSTNSSAPATLSVDAPGKPMITVRGRTGSTAGEALSISRSANGEVAVGSGSSAPVRTTISTQTQTVNLQAPSSTEVHLSPAAAPEASIVTAQGGTLASYDTAENAPTAVSTTALELNASNDGFVIARSLTLAEAPSAAPIIENASAMSTPASASASPTRERKEKSESERGKRNERASKPRPDRTESASAEPSASASPTRTRNPERSPENSGSSGHGDSTQSGQRTPSGAASPTLSATASPSTSVSPTASASPSASGTAGSTASASPSGSASSSPSASASASATRSQSATPTPTPTPTPSPSSSKKNDDKPKKNDDKPKKQDEDED